MAVERCHSLSRLRERVGVRVFVAGRPRPDPSAFPPCGRGSQA